MTTTLEITDELAEAIDSLRVELGGSRTDVLTRLVQDASRELDAEQQAGLVSQADKTRPSFEERRAALRRLRERALSLKLPPSAGERTYSREEIYDDHYFARFMEPDSPATGSEASR